VAEGNLVDWLRSGESLAERLTGSPLNRPRRAGLARNAALALAHAPSENGRDALLGAMESDPSALVREAAAWSLRTAHNRDAGVPEALDRAKRGGSIPAGTT
jgi:epoxyqueuosine reductase QueG